MTIDGRGDFLVFGFARTGSTSLMRALNEIPGVACANEPFNLDNPLVRTIPTTSEELSVVRATLWSSWNAFKHTWHPAGWPFENDPALNYELLTGSCRKVLFLTRRNALSRLVSLFVSNQTRVWEIDNDAQRRHIAAFTLAPLDRSWVRAQLEVDARGGARALARLQDSGVPHLHVEHETLFLSPSEDARRREFARIVAFLDYPQEPRPAAFGFLDPGRRKIASPAIYERIPGIADIDAEFGSTDVGWLFPGR